MIKQFKPDNDIILSRSDNNDPNYVLINNNIDESTVRCLISYVKYIYDSISYCIIKIKEDYYKIKFLNNNIEKYIFINLNNMFLFNNTLFLLTYSNNLDEFKKFNLIKNRYLKLKQICS